MDIYLNGNDQTGQTRADRLNSQSEFLDAYSKCGNVARAAKLAGISRAVHYKWMRTDPKYRESFKLVGDVVFDLLHEEALRRAVEGIERPVFYQGVQCGSYRQYSDRLLIRLLTMFNPGKYGS